MYVYMYVCIYMYIYILYIYICKYIFIYIFIYLYIGNTYRNILMERGSGITKTPLYGKENWKHLP